MLDVIDEEKLQENCANVGTYFLNELAKLRDEFEIVGDVRGKGLMIGVELVEDKVSKNKIHLLMSICNFCLYFTKLQTSRKQGHH